MMFCANCYKEIPAGKSYYKHQDTNQSYCSLDCLNDHMIYKNVAMLPTETLSLIFSLSLTFAPAVT